MSTRVRVLLTDRLPVPCLWRLRLRRTGRPRTHRLRKQHRLRVSMDDIHKPRAGALRYQDTPDGPWTTANPGDLMFSTVTMLATEYWNGTEWEPIYTDDEDEDED